MLFSERTVSGHRWTPTLGTAVWLLQLRWVAVAGQMLTIGMVHWGLGIRLPLLQLTICVALTAVTNILLGTWLRLLKRGGMTASEHLRSTNLVGVVMVFDVITLSFLLHWSGGTTNPFLFFYFANLAVSGLMLTVEWAWILSLVSIIGVVALLVVSKPLDEFELVGLDSKLFTDIKNQGLWVAFATCCVVVTYFVTELARELHLRELQLQDAEEQRARSRRLEALATLAAGAGHELASPLSTIAVISKELSRRLDKTVGMDAVRKDVDLIRSELDRCREILDRMKSGAGEAAAEQLDPLTMRRLIDEILIGLRDTSRVQMRVPENILKSQGILPIQALSQAVRNVIQNALDASEPSGIVTVDITEKDDKWLIVVRDQGEGMSPETLSRMGEPFFTTKEPGRGMGLGVFLVRNVIHRLGGEITYTSQVGVGTECTISLPRNSN
jgi:two-component system, sensor histidine kinase RegB